MDSGSSVAAIRGVLGLRGFRRDWYHTLDQRCTGMEFATEMIIKASLYGAKIAEVPITLHPDGRKAHAPHLKTFRDGWRTLRFFMMYSPRWLFLMPGILLCLLVHRVQKVKNISQFFFCETVALAWQ